MALAERIGLHFTFAGEVERGERNLGLASLRRLADGLGVNPADLVDDLHREEPRERGISDRPATYLGAISVVAIASSGAKVLAKNWLPGSIVGASAPGHAATRPHRRSCGIQRHANFDNAH